MSDGTGTAPISVLPGEVPMWEPRCTECGWHGRENANRSIAKRRAEAHRDTHHNYAIPSTETPEETTE